MRPIPLQQGDRIPGTRLCYLEDTHRTNLKRRRALFLCDCGVVIAIDLRDALHHNTYSCGCLKRELVAQQNTIHGQAPRGAQTGAYRSWAAMHGRIKFDPYYAHVKRISTLIWDQGPLVSPLSV
jgi:hypothetical protein